MNEADAFLAAILADPSSDAPRLLLADWWEDHGQMDRAAFVRVQCRLAALDFAEDCTCDDEDRDKPCVYHIEARLKRRERELLEAHGLAWAPIPSAPPPNCNEFFVRPAGSPWSGVATDLYFRRGFVERAQCTAAAWLIHADDLTAAAPIREVRLTTLLEAFYFEDNWSLAPSHGGAVRRTKAKLRQPEMGNIGVQLPHVLAAEWPRIAFELP